MTGSKTEMQASHPNKFASTTEKIAWTEVNTFLISAIARVHFKRPSQDGFLEINPRKERFANR